MNTPMLVINYGSFSLDYALIDSDPQEPGTGNHDAETGGS